MGYHLIGFLTTVFIGFTIINRILEGGFITVADVSIINDVVVFRPANFLGMFTIGVPNLSFITTGLPHLVNWEYSFFGGDAAIIQYLLYSFTAVISFILLLVIIGGVAGNILSRAKS